MGGHAGTRHHRPVPPRIAPHCGARACPRQRRHLLVARHSARAGLDGHSCPATASLAAALEQSLAFAAKNAPGSRDRATKERMPLRSTGRRADLEHVGPSTPPTASSGDYSGPLSTVKLTPDLSSNGARKLMYSLVALQCHEAKTSHFSNGHYEGPIDFFDQPF